MQERGKIPIVCGGTNYYIEALLFEDETNEADKFNEEEFYVTFDQMRESVSEEKKAKLCALLDSFRANIPIDNKQEIEDTFEAPICHELLQEVDPEMALHLH